MAQSRWNMLEWKPQLRTKEFPKIEKKEHILGYSVLENSMKLAKMKHTDN